DRHVGDAELSGQVGDPDRAVVADLREDALLALRGKHATSIVHIAEKSNTIEQDSTSVSCDRRPPPGPPKRAGRAVQYRLASPRPPRAGTGAGRGRAGAPAPKVATILVTAAEGGQRGGSCAGYAMSASSGRFCRATAAPATPRTPATVGATTLAIT